MTKVEIYKYYSFGYNYFILLNNSSLDTVSLFSERITSYYNFISELKLKVTSSSLRLQNIENDLEKLNKLNKGKKKNEQIPTELFNSIIEKIKNTDKTLDAELNVINAYYLNTNKRISQDILENKIENLFANNIFTSLPDIASYDFSQAGKCLLFNLHTACAFHTLRGTEDVLKFFYQKLLNKIPDESQTWWNFTNEIENNIKDNKIEPKPNEELLINLNSLRKYYRNTTQHPQKIYNEDDAQDLLFLCIKTVNEMMLDLEKRKLVVFLPF